MIIVLAILLVILFAPEAYMYFSFIAQTSWGIKLLYYVPILLVGLTIVLILNEDNQTIKFRHLGIAVTILICMQLPKLLLTVCSLLGRLFTLFGFSIVPFNIAGLVLGGALIGFLIYGIWNVFSFQVNKVDFVSPKVPDAFNGYKIVHLSDIHIGSWNRNGKKLEEAVRLINDQHADAIFFTGDLVNNLSEELEPFKSILGKLQAPDGIYSVLGNHDYASYVHYDSAKAVRELIATERAMGWHLLLNEHTTISRNGDSIAVIGVENQGKYPFPHLGDLPKASAGTESMFRILLSHDPTHWTEEVLPRTDIPLTLSGHTHASQIDFPWFSPSKSLYPENRGLYVQGNQSLYVNVGLGYTFFPIRIGNAKPEITVITLKKGN